MSEDVYLIGCHVENEQQADLLKRLVNHLHFFGKDFVLVSHTPLPEECINKSVGYIYDKSNPVFWRWELEDTPEYYFTCPKFNVLSKYILYGASPYYHVGVLRLLINGIKYIKTLDYKIVHWIEYDMFPDFDRAEENKKYILEGNQFVFHGLGSFFSFDAKIQFKHNLNSLNNKTILGLLKNNKYVAELVIMNDFFESEPLKVFDVLKNSGDYSQNFDNVKVHWSLFMENEHEVHIFLLNHQKKQIIVNYSYNDKNDFKILLPNMYHRSHLGWLKLDGKTKIEIKVDGEVFFELEDDSQKIFDKLIRDTKVWQNA